MRFAIWVVAFAVVAWGPGGASASDGVIEINQSRAEAGDVTAGDLPGFPVVLSQTGSYRLTSDLRVDAAVHAIGAGTGGVTIDLNGFTIFGPCATGSSECKTGGSGAGIAAPLGLVAVRNGSVFGTNDDCLQLGPSSHVENVTAFFCGSDGIDMGAGGIVRSSQAISNAGFGLRLGPGTSFAQNESRQNQQGSRVGGVATAGNFCDDGRCTRDGRRRYFLSTTSVPGSQALTACGTGFHMASLPELHAATTLAYDAASAPRSGLDGVGPPTQLYRWVRTLAPSDVDTVNGNCALWTSTTPATYGRILKWGSASTSAPLGPWIAQAGDCSVPSFVWCVED
jgi:hypothetical protein